MTDARRKTKILLLQQKRTFTNLAEASGLAEATVHNVLDGKASSRKSKQAITNALGGTVFDGIQVTERRVVLPVGLEIELDNEAEALCVEEEFHGFIKHSGRKISFIKPTPATIGKNESAPANKATLSVRDHPTTGST